jgi:hypothetical protein
MVLKRRWRDNAIHAPNVYNSSSYESSGISIGGAANYKFDLCNKINKCLCIKYISSRVINYQHVSIAFVIITGGAVCNAACNIAHSITCTRLFRGKMHSGWFNGIDMLQGRWQHGDKSGILLSQRTWKDSL